MKDIVELIIKAGGKLKLELKSDEIKVERPMGFGFGDWTTNVAMVMAKKEKQNPMELAQNLVKEIEKPDYIDKIEVAGAGFINFYLTKEFLISEAERVNYEAEFKKRLAAFGKKGKKRGVMVIDYSGPNIAKSFGIGHLRSTNIGQAIYNIYKVLGWKCIGDNHLGDWGTQFGKLIVAIKKWGEKDASKMTIDELEKLYVRFHKEAEEDESLNEEGQRWFAKLEKGDKDVRDLWQKIVDLSIVEFDRIYKILDVSIDETKGESFYEPMLEGIIKEVKQKGLAKESKGALIVELDNVHMPPAMLRKSDGATAYFTRDMAAIKYRMEEWNPDLIVYEVGADQSLHFRQLFAVAKKMGWWPERGMVHVAHGLLRWKDAKFSTRKGDTIHLEEVIERAREKAKKVASERQVDKKMGKEERDEVAEVVAIGAIKFADLITDPRKDIIFDWERVMSLDGNSGPYLQYTYARCKSVLGKTEIKEQKNLDKVPEKMEAEELVLVKLLGRFEEKIVEAALRFSPSVVAEYLIDLARAYNEFYAKHKILDQKEETLRVFLTRSVASTIKMGLGLLGIKTVEKM